MARHAARPFLIPPQNFVFGSSLVILLLFAPPSSRCLHTSTLEESCLRSTSTPTSSGMDLVPSCSSSHKYCSAMFWVASVSSHIYLPLTLSSLFLSHFLSHSSDEHSPEEQVQAPWVPRHDTVTTQLCRPLSHLAGAPFIPKKAVCKETNQGPTNCSSGEPAPHCSRAFDECK